MCPDKNLLSTYFDGELDDRFAVEIEAHIAECDFCKSALEDFRSLSSVLRRAETPACAQSKRSTWRMLRGKFSSLYPAPVWKRRLQIPAPLMAAAAFLVVVLSVGLVVSLVTEKESNVFDSVTRTRIENVQFVTFEDIIAYLDARGGGQTYVFTLPQNANLQYFSEPTLIKAADYKRGRD